MEDGIESKRCRWAMLAERAAALPRPLVLTNGVFDLLQRGHVEYLAQARSHGRSLVVGVNADASVRRLGKGAERPIVGEDDRAAVVAALASVSLVVVFAEPTPRRLVELLRPEVYAKGGDYDACRLAEAALLAPWGGRAITLPYLPQRSTSGLIARIRGLV
jgi:rfaE bifunctional protein nucleotidyltransferase chain/domain